LKKIYIVFFTLLAIQITSWLYFNETIKQANEKLNDKNEIITQLYELDKTWSKKNQKLELKRIYDFLNAFDIKYEVKEKKNKKTITLQLKKPNSNKVISFILNKNIRIKQFKLDKLDNYNLRLILEVI